MSSLKDKFKFFNKLSGKENLSAPLSDATDLVPFEEIGPGCASGSAVAPSMAVPFLTLGQAARVAQMAAEIPAPVKAVARMSVKSGFAGGIVDAGLAGFNALGPLQRKEIDLKQMGIHVASEGICGFLTAGAGTAGSISAYMLTGSLGPVVIASGMASSMAMRYGYRCVVGETLPDPKSATRERVSNSSDTDDKFEDIGPNE